ncbi:MAG: hypothetical protein HQ519_08740 [Planctomycetes bacterium]|nr:hypothetical protein [Planctomycetota bacterium]
MNSNSKRGVVRQPIAGFATLPLLLLAGLVVAVVLYVAASNRQTQDGPKDVIWDKTACVFCAMHLGDPRFAAQLSTEDGDTYFYDDPGCLFLHQHELEQGQTSIHSRWFHKMDGQGWLNESEVAFLRAENTPMDYGFGAVVVGSPNAIDLKTAAAEVLAQ